MSSRLSDRILGFTIACGAAALGLMAWARYPFEAALFPVIVLILIVVAAAVLFIANGSGSAGNSRQSSPPSAALRVGIVLIATAVAIPWLGFYASCLAATIGAPVASVGRAPRPAELAVDAGYGVAIVVVVYLTFEVWLKVQPPHGLLF